MTFRGPGMPVFSSARFDCGPNDFLRFDIGALYEVNGREWICTRINTVVGTVDLTPVEDWDKFRRGIIHRRPEDVPDEYDRVGIIPIQYQ